ncbi:hypothetical protein [Mycobacterium sp.]|uniref:hypothetical protein n=1 Tax=Mycobacterium sp. TaxID=1785 RepID=UPI00334287E3
MCSAPAEADAELEFPSCADGFPVGEDGDSVAFLCGRGSRAGGVLLAFGVASSALVLVVPDADGVVVGFASAGAATAVLLSPVVGSGTASCDSSLAAWVATLAECGWGATDFVVESPTRRGHACRWSQRGRRDHRSRRQRGSAYTERTGICRAQRPPDTEVLQRIQDSRCARRRPR